MHHTQIYIPITPVHITAPHTQHTPSTHSTHTHTHRYKVAAQCCSCRTAHASSNSTGTPASPSARRRRTPETATQTARDSGAHTPTGTHHWRPAVPRQFLIVNGAHKTSLRRPRPAGWPTDAPPPTRAAAALIPCGMLPLPPPCHGRRPGAADIVCVPRYCLDARGIPTGRGSRAARERHFYSLDNCAVRCPAIRTVREV